MPRSALLELSSHKFLLSAWTEMYNRASKNARLSKGIDGISLLQFEKYNADFLKTLSKDLRSDLYQPQSLAPHFIPKSNGKDRVICVPTVRDRLVQRAIGKLLYDKGYTLHNSISYGFVKGRSVKKAATKAVDLRLQKPWAYKADISAFFDRIDRTLLINKMKSSIRLKSLHPILIKIINTEISTTSKQYEKRIRKLGIRRGEGLRQGMPISPYLANLMLKDFDNAILDKDIAAIRYADDLIAFGNSLDDCNEIHNICVEQLKKEKLTIHPLLEGKKTTIASPDETVDFLGLGLAPISGKYELIVTKDQFKSIKGKLAGMSDIKRCVEQGITLAKYMQRLEGKISGFRGAYDLCQNTEQLNDALKASKNSSLAKLLKNLGIEEKNLTKSQLIFLGINKTAC